MLTEFFKNFAPFSAKRCQMMLNAMTKVVYTIMRVKYGLEHGAIANVKPKKAQAKNKKAGAKAQKKPRRGKDPSSSDSESDFEASFDDCCSDDSLFQANKVAMEVICKSVNVQLLLNMVMVVLSRKYINEKAAKGFKLQTELTVVFFQRLLLMNQTFFKKTQVIKEVVLPALETVMFETCDSLE